MMYSVSSRESLEQLETVFVPEVWMLLTTCNSQGRCYCSHAVTSQIEKYGMKAGGNVPFIFVGNKNDLRENDDKPEEELVPESEGVAAAKRCRMPLFWVSNFRSCSNKPDSFSCCVGSCGAYAHLLCSNLLQRNLKEVFSAAISLSLLQMHGALPEQEKKSKRGCPVQ
jgi:GTPase SAR1 family protein